MTLPSNIEVTTNSATEKIIKSIMVDIQNKIDGKGCCNWNEEARGLQTALEIIYKKSPPRNLLTGEIECFRQTSQKCRELHEADCDRHGSPCECMCHEEHRS